jgi:hypothetical protein
MKFSPQNVHKNLARNREFRVYRLSERHTLFKDVIFSPSRLMSDLGEIRYNKSAHKAVEHIELRENRRRDGRPFITWRN